MDSRTPPRLTPIALTYALIVATLVLLFYIGTQVGTGVRGFVGGESEWSKAQKQAAACLQRYALSFDDEAYACYERHGELTGAATRARAELSRAAPDMAAARGWLVRAGAHPTDAPEMAAVFRWFGESHLMRNVIGYWVAGDSAIAEMDGIAQELRRHAQAGSLPDTAARAVYMERIREVDERLTTLESGFAAGLGTSARYISRVLLLVVILCGTLLFGVAAFFSRRWIRSWRHMQQLASGRAARMRAVADAAAGVGNTSTLQELDAVLLKAIGSVIEMDACTFGTYDPETESFSFLPGTVNGEYVAAVNVPIRGTPSERFLRSPGVIVTHTSADPAAQGARAFGSDRLSESVIRCPMYSANRLIGMVSVHSYTPQRYTRDDVEVVEALASVAASAVARIDSMRARRAAQEDLRRSEEQLAQAQKMEAVGRLAGGVAHDFNNLLTSIRGNSDMLRDDASLPPDLREHVCEIAAAADRAAALTGQLLAFSRRQVLQPRVVDLNTLVAEMNTLMRRLIGEDITMMTSLDPDLGHVRADPHQMEQVILNLALNARDAMPQRGCLTIETCNVDLYEPVPDMPSIGPGSYIRLSVQDSGVGMTEEARARVFEPFYTTKGVGKGTGLGLSTVYGIVKQSGGHIYVSSEPGAGTNMQIYLPRTFDPLDAPLPTSPPYVKPDSIGAATILVVEDESTVRTLLARVLTREGYNVVEAASGEEAMAILNAEFEVDLLITDTVMPGMSGVALARRASAMRPDLAILHMSGYTEDEVFRRGLSSGGQAFLQKPFTPAVLLASVVDALTYAARPTA